MVPLHTFALALFYLFEIVLGPLYATEHTLYARACLVLHGGPCHVLCRVFVALPVHGMVRGMVHGRTSMRWHGMHVMHIKQSSNWATQLQVSTMTYT